MGADAGRPDAAQTASTMTGDEKKRVLALFDVDGTLTIARQVIEQPMKDALQRLKASGVCIGVVGGSDMPKQLEQLNMKSTEESVFHYNFSENGVVAYKNKQQSSSGTGPSTVESRQINCTSMTEFLGEDRLQTFLNFCLVYMGSKMPKIPKKRGTFVEYRTGMLNISPIGRACARDERNEYEKFDLEHKVRENFVNALKAEFGPFPDGKVPEGKEDYGLQFSIGGQISFDVFPRGWDKTYCLRFLTAKEPVASQPDAKGKFAETDKVFGEDYSGCGPIGQEFDEIHFFGDKTFEGGNDFEIFSHELVTGHTVTAPEDTIKQLGEIFGI